MSFFDIHAVSTDDYRRLARRRLPRFLFDYIDGGANDEWTMARNESAFFRYTLRQRVMHNVADVDTSVSLAGQSCSMPIALAPVGMAGMMARRGEVLGASSSKRAGVPFTTSTLGICAVEEIQLATRAPFWFQLYMLKDRDIVLGLLERARKAGVGTLVFTVDLAMPGMRLRDFRNGMVGADWKSKLVRGIQIAASPHWVYNVALRGKPHNFGNLSNYVEKPDDFGSYRAFVESQFDPSVTWDDIRWLRDQWPGKLLIKGVMEVDDATAAVDAGADGVIVSNHGGRQLDGVAGTIEKLPAIKRALDESIEIYLDGGIRSGIDVVKAIALGADAALIGRPWVWAAAARGEQGLNDYLGLLQREISVAMALMGVTKIADIGPEHLDELV